MFNAKKFFLIAGPCVIEGREMILSTARQLKEITEALDIEFVFKASFDKANRTSIHSFRGPGFEKGLDILAEVKEKIGVKVLSDIHTPEMIAPAAEVLDMLQLPAFLARQTDFFIEAAKTGRPFNVKKGQFMSPAEMEQAVNKFRESGGRDICITERGSFFGYGNLVVDFRSIQIIKSLGVPYIYDATHSLQLPAGNGSSSGGQREFLPSLARAQTAAGADGLFMEIHPDVNNAKCDKENQWPLEKTEALLKQLKDIYTMVRSFKEF